MMRCPAVILKPTSWPDWWSQQEIGFMDHSSMMAKRPCGEILTVEIVHHRGHLVVIRRCANGHNWLQRASGNYWLR